MDNKTLAWVSYLFTPIGFLISYFSYNGQEKNSLVSYHLRQSFGLFLASVAYGIVTFLISFILGMISIDLAITVGYILNLVSLVFLVLMIIGILNANKGEEKPLPLIGKMFEGKFNFIP